MKFAEAKKLRKQNPTMEHELRAAKVTTWMLDNKKIEKKEAEGLYRELAASMENSNEEYDEIVFYILDELRAIRKEKEKKGGKKK